MYSDIARLHGAGEAIRNAVRAQDGCFLDHRRPNGIERQGNRNALLNNSAAWIRVCAPEKEYCGTAKEQCRGERTQASRAKDFRLVAHALIDRLRVSRFGYDRAAPLASQFKRFAMRAINSAVFPVFSGAEYCGLLMGADLL